MTTTNTTDITTVLKDIGKMIGNLPNVVGMGDDRALLFGDLGSALILASLYLADFRTTGCMVAARKWLDMSTRTSNEITVLSATSGSRQVGQALLLAQRALVEAHTQFRACVEVKIAANRAA